MTRCVYIINLKMRYHYKNHYRQIGRDSDDERARYR